MDKNTSAKSGQADDQLIGTRLPPLELQASTGKTMKLPQDLAGMWTILYFYPKDDTPGCTAQACGYRDQLADAPWQGKIRVLGVSADDLDSHSAFIRKYGLSFPLIADTEKKLSQTLGVWGEQEWQGKKYMGLSRDSFLISPEGQIKMIWRKVNPTTSVEQTINAAIEHAGL